MASVSGVDRGCASDLPPDMPKPAANQTFGSKSSFWQQMKKTHQKLFLEDGLYCWRQKEIKNKIVGGKSLFAGNAGFNISGGKSLTHPLQFHVHELRLVAFELAIDARCIYPNGIRHTAPFPIE